MQPGHHVSDGWCTKKLRGDFQAVQRAPKAGACLYLRHRSRNHRYNGHQRDCLLQ